MISAQKHSLKCLFSKLLSELVDIHVCVLQVWCVKFLLTLLTPSDQDGDEDGYDTMVVKEDDNESVVSYFMFLGLD